MKKMNEITLIALQMAKCEQIKLNVIQYIEPSHCVFEVVLSEDK